MRIRNPSAAARAAPQHPDPPEERAGRVRHATPPFPTPPLDHTGAPMRFLSFRHDDRARFGAVVDPVGSDADPSDVAVVDLTDRFDGVTDLSDLIGRSLLDDARAVAADARPDLALADVEFSRTVPRPGRIFCIGVNYGGRNAEYKDGQDNTAKPSVFIRFPSSLVGHDEALVRPPESEQLDYEGEIVAVVGQGGRRIPQDRALDHLAG